MEEVEKLSPSSMDTDKDDGDDDETALLPGFRFHPTDQELVDFYLRRKVEKRPAKIDLIKHVDVYKYEPWDLPKVVSRVGESEWYFFCMRGRKYKNSIRPNRVTGSGFWKATGIDKPIYSLGEAHDCVGLKKSLVYYRGSAGKGTKTDWMMHEFRLPAAKSSSANSTQEAEVWTLCRIFKRESSYRKYPPDWRKFSSKQSCYSESISKASHSESELWNKYENGFDLLGDKGIEKKPPAAANNLYDGNRCQLSLTSQVPFVASYLSFAGAGANGDHENLVDGNWDELRPMVDFALDQSMTCSLR